jgi:hypothetical protein
MRLRKYRRYFRALIVSAYIVSGLTLIAGAHSPQIHGCLYVLIGILHGVT